MLGKIVFFFALSLGTLSVACEKGESPSAPEPVPQPSSTIVYTALGASDALAIGGSVPCIPFQDCPNGTGYVQITVRDLRARAFTVRLSNLGWPTSTISRRLQTL